MNLNSVRRVSKAHARGHFAKKLYGLQGQTFLTQKNAQNAGILP